MPTNAQVQTGGPSEPSPPPAAGTAGATAAGEGADGAGGAGSKDMPPIAESHVTVEPTTGIQPEPNPSESLKRHREEGSRVVLPGQGYAGSWQPSADPQTPHQLLPQQQTGWEAAVATAAAATHTATTAPPPAARSRSSPPPQVGQLSDAEQTAPKPGGGTGGGAERSRPRNALERREWTTEEDDIIRSGVKQFGYRWRRIASLPQLQGRSDDAVRNRWSRLKGGGDTTTASAPEEAAAAAAPGQADRGGEGGEGGAKGDGSGPDAAPPPVRRRSSTGSAGEDGGGGAKRERIGWTQAEDAIIISTVREIGHKWYRIAQRIPGRTEHAIRNRWQRLLRMVEDTQPPPSPSLFLAVGGAGPEEPAR